MIEGSGKKTASIILAPMNFMTDENIKLRQREPVHEVYCVPEESLTDSTQISDFMSQWPLCQKKVPDFQALILGEKNLHEKLSDILEEVLLIKEIEEEEGTCVGNQKILDGHHIYLTKLVREKEAQLR